MEIDRPDIKADVEAAFARYERARVGPEQLVERREIVADPRTVRFGIGEALYGIDAIRAFRNARPATGLARTLRDTVVTTFGTDFATASTLFGRDGAPDRGGRQQQSWARLEGAWRIVAAHVSMVA